MWNDDELKNVPKKCELKWPKSPQMNCVDLYLTPNVDLIWTFSGLSGLELDLHWTLTDFL